MCIKNKLFRYSEKPLDMLCRSFKGSEDDKLETRESFFLVFRHRYKIKN